MKLVMRLLLCLTLGAASAATQEPGSAPEANAPAEMEVILLGTGFPRPHPDRAGPSTMVVVNGKVFVVDAGRGVAMRYWATGYRFPELQAVFLTHLHSDHIGGLPDLFNTSWVIRRRHPFELYGPRGTQGLADAMLEFYAEDIHIRRDLTEMLPPAGATINTHEIPSGTESRVVYEDEDVRVTAFRVSHEPVVNAFGYKFEAGGKTVVISGDTAVSENLIKHARGADILIHEAYLPDYFAKVDSPEVANRLGLYHTTAEQAGQVAAKAGVKMLVLTHIIPPDNDAGFLRDASKHFKGKIVVGRDLMRF